MPDFELLNPDAMPTDARLLLRSTPNDFPKQEHFFVVWQGYLVVYDQQLHYNPEDDVSKWIRDQVEFPLAIVAWLPWALEEKFFKAPNEGGIPAGSISYRDTLEGESLLMNRSGGVAGYRLVNMSRYDYISSVDYQDIQFTDQWLFDQGLLDQFKAWAEQYRNGEL